MFKLRTGLAGASALLSSAFIYATFGPLIRETTKMFGNNAQVAVRFALAALLVLAWRLVARKKLTLPKMALVKTAALGIAFGIVVMLFTISVNRTTIANSVFMIYAGSILSSLFIGTVLLKEKLTSGKIVAIMLALLGLTMYAHTFTSLNIGIVTGFIAGLFDGVGNGIRKTLKGVDRSLAVMYPYAVGAGLSLIVALFSGEQWVHRVNAGPVIALVVFSVMMVGLSNLLLYGFQHFDVNVGTVILATELFFAVVVGFLLFREVPAANEWMGGSLIFVASAVSVFDLRFATVRGLVSRLRAKALR